MKYFSNSVDFPLFSSSLIDSLVINSFSLILLALILCVGFYLFICWVREFNFKILNVFLIAICIFYFNESLAKILLYLMRTGVIETQSLYLTYVAKSVYYVHFYPYILLGFVLVSMIL
ncbi:DUF2318 domain-containing protein, partial [Campylobacter volucris]|nr:DUF2318 domain-containing protein [Campylobacter volucris]